MVSPPLPMITPTLPFGISIFLLGPGWKSSMGGGTLAYEGGAAAAAPGGDSEEIGAENPVGLRETGEGDVGSSYFLLFDPASDAYCASSAIFGPKEGEGRREQECVEGSESGNPNLDWERTRQIGAME
nr:hypothetical protein Iba_chr10fCG10090 [Ipomoea batatas]